MLFIFSFPNPSKKCKLNTTSHAIFNKVLRQVHQHKGQQKHWLPNVDILSVVGSAKD